MRLKNKVAIVTGASRGIGKAIALAFAREGADLVVIGRSKEDLDELTTQIKTCGRQCLSIIADVTKEKEVNEAAQKALDQFGKIDILVNNAGVGLFKSIRETSVEEWNQVIAVNLTGTFLFTRAVLDDMAERGQGQIINISSDVGVRTIPRAAAYCASKYGVEGFTGVLAKEVRKMGIKVGVIRPGMTDSYFNDSIQGAPEKEGWLKVEDVAEAAVYMATAPRHALIDEIMVHPMIQEY